MHPLLQDFTRCSAWSILASHVIFFLPGIACGLQFFHHTLPFCEGPLPTDTFGMGLGSQKAQQFF